VTARLDLDPQGGGFFGKQVQRREKNIVGNEEGGLKGLFVKAERSRKWEITNLNKGERLLKEDDVADASKRKFTNTQESTMLKWREFKKGEPLWGGKKRRSGLLKTAGFDLGNSRKGGNQEQPPPTRVQEQPRTRQGGDKVEATEGEGAF